MIPASAMTNETLTTVDHAENHTKDPAQDRAEIAATLMAVATSTPPPQVFASSIGTGIATDATAAAHLAIRDAIERGALLQQQQTSHIKPILQIQLGSPVTILPPEERRLLDRFPPGTTLQVCPGGLLVPASSGVTGGADTPSKPTLTPTFVVVACATLRRPESSPRDPHNFKIIVGGDTAAPIKQKLQPPSPSSILPRRSSSSMDMLAQVSAELITTTTTERRNNTKNVNDDAGDNKQQQLRPYSYKKLPPGKTPKNHKRLFVEHSYRDHSMSWENHQEQLDPKFSASLTSATTAQDAIPLRRTSIMAFPLKLHHVLSQVHADGHDDIVGWLPHGRSFKIFKQADFCHTILPKYFVMTKKSSFLRQLNLYGFHRLSSPGPDQGSYYHERFLRGLPHLSKSMVRQKINGNGIRAAGNPDQEPVLSRFPVCPPSVQKGAGAGAMQSTTTDEVAEQRPAPTPSPVRLLPKPNKAVPMIESTTHRQRQQSTPQTATFPMKLQRILDRLEADGNTSAISWLSHGRAFLVHNPDLFVSDIMPRYFSQTKYSSFQRQCAMYHFQRLTVGPDKKAYYHKSLQRGRPALAASLQRTRVNGNGTRRPGNPEEEPDLYSMDPRPPIKATANIEEITRASDVSV